MTSYHDNILKNIDDQKIKNKEKLTLINEKLLKMQELLPQQILLMDWHQNYMK